jgi:hypothetical protein
MDSQAETFMGSRHRARNHRRAEMTPEQRAAAERLADAKTRIPGQLWAAEVVALLRELLAEPVQEPVAYIDPRQLAAGYVTLLCITRPEYRSYADVAEGIHYTPVYLHPAQQRKPLTPSMQAEVECDCLVAWNASTYGHSAQDTVHPMFLSAFLRGYRAAERAHGIGETP